MCEWCERFRLTDNRLAGAAGVCEENRKARDHGPCWCTGFSRRVRARPTEVGTPACAAPFPPFLAFVCRPPTTDRFRLTGLTGMPPIGYIVRQLIM